MILWRAMLQLKAEVFSFHSRGRRTTLSILHFFHGPLIGEGFAERQGALPLLLNAGTQSTCACQGVAQECGHLQPYQGLRLVLGGSSASTQSHVREITFHWTENAKVSS